MGVDTNFHIGPFLVAKGTVKEKFKERGNGCVNKKCGKYHQASSGKFCKECGKEIGEYKYTTVETYNADNLLRNVDEFEDDLVYTDPMCGKDYTFISNKRAPFDTPARDNIDEGGNISLSTINPEKEMEWFRKTFSKQISFLKEKLGDKNVFVDWGVIVWYS